MTVQEVDVHALNTDEIDAAKEDHDSAGVDTNMPAVRERRLSISLRGLVFGAVIAALVIAVTVLTWMYIGLSSKYDAQARLAADNARAEQIALDYATEAAAMDYKDLGAWKEKLVAGTTPELDARLTEAAAQMEQILVPLEWSSTASPLTAKVRSDAEGIYVVDSFVSVLTKTVQGQEPLQSTATYSITVDSNNDWKISDVGGIGAAVAPK